MTEPSQKSPQMRAFLDDLSKSLFGNDRTSSIEGNTCVICSGPAVEFRDPVSRREYQISGMCQVCQDKTFGAPDDHEYRD